MTLDAAFGPTLYSGAPLPRYAAAETGAPIHTYLTAAPAADARAAGVVLFFHGFGLHARMERYGALYRALAGQDMLVLAWDCPHHGTSSSLGPSSPSHPLKPLRLSPADDLADDALQFVAAARRLYPDLPVVLVGESMGGALALRIAAAARVAAVCTVAGAVPNRLSRAWLTGGLRANWAMLRAVWAAPRAEVAIARHDPLIKIGPARASVRRCIHGLMRGTDYATLAAPLLAVIGTRDAFFSVADTVAMLTRCRGGDPLDRVLYVAPEGRHDDTSRRPDVVDAVARFAARHCAREG